jgi:hypothetical protein
MEGYHVAGLQEVAEVLNEGRAEGMGSLRRGARRPGEDVHAKGGGTLRDEAAGTAEADDAEGGDGDPAWLTAR